ncbi:MAG TPA: type II secretion system protein M [Telluria sp.]
MKALTNRLVPVFAPARDRFAVMWLARTPQERTFLTVGAAILGVTFFYLALLAPAIEGRAQLKRSLPELRQQAAQLRTMADEARALAGQAPAQVAPLSRETVTASLTARGLAPQNLSVTGNYAKFQLENVAFANLMAWLDEQRRTTQLGVEEAQISAQTPLGQVNATLTMRQHNEAGQ